MAGWSEFSKFIFHRAPPKSESKFAYWVQNGWANERYVCNLKMLTENRREKNLSFILVSECFLQIENKQKFELGFTFWLLILWIMLEYYSENWIVKWLVIKIVWFFWHSILKIVSSAIFSPLWLRMMILFTPGIPFYWNYTFCISVSSYEYFYISLFKFHWISLIEVANHMKDCKNQWLDP